MLEKVKKYKFLLIIILFLFICLFINKKVDAISTSAGEFPSFPSKFNDTTHDIVIINHGSWTNNNHYMAFPKGKGYFCYENGIIVFKNTTSSTVSGYRGDVLSTSWKTTYTASATANNTYSWSEMGVDTNEPGNYDTDGKRHIIYTTSDIYKTDGSIYYSNIPSEVRQQYFYLEYNENTCSYFVYTDWFSAYDLSKYNAFYSDSYKNTFNILSYDSDGWKGMYTEIKNSNSEEPSEWRQYREILDYGEYYFSLYNSDTKEYNISKIVLSENGDSYISNYNKSSDDFYIIEDINNINFNNYNMYVLYDNYSATIYSNYFKYNDIYNYEIMYSLDGVYYDYEMMIDQKDTTNENYGYYRYYKEVSENRTYYFRLRVYDPENNGTIIDTQYFTINVDKISTELNENQTIEFYKNTNVYKYFKNNFGLLFYPIDIMIEFFDRLSQVQYVEPCINIPTIREPFTNTVLINEFTFNLNDVLEDNNILHIYNIYLIFVDCILYFIVFSFMYKVFKTFFNFGGGL